MKNYAIAIIAVLAIGGAGFAIWYFLREKKECSCSNGQRTASNSLATASRRNLIGCGAAECEGYVRSGNGCCYRDQQPRTNIVL